MLNIIVCIKQVPLNQNINMDPERGTLIRDSSQVGMNPYDRYALEAALTISEKWGANLSVFTMGPQSAKQVLLEAYSMGTENCYLITDEAFSGADVFVTTFTLANAINATQKYDLIICGRQTTDGDTAQVGPSLAGQLKIPCVSWVTEINRINEDGVVVTYKDDTGFVEAQLDFPCLISVETTVGLPRIPTLKRKLQAKKADIKKIGLIDLKVSDARFYGLNASPTRVIKIYSPIQEKKGEIIRGSFDEKVKFLIKKITEINKKNHEKY
jgi:electron transfer flavoprotein beta subunit